MFLLPFPILNLQKNPYVADLFLWPVDRPNFARSRRYDDATRLGSSVI